MINSGCIDIKKLKRKYVNFMHTIEVLGAKVQNRLDEMNYSRSTIYTFFHLNLRSYHKVPHKF